QPDHVQPCPKDSRRHVVGRLWNIFRIGVAMITSVTYGRTFNLGNYESERLDCHVTLDDGKSPFDAMQEARSFVEAQHNSTIEVRTLEAQTAEYRQQLHNLRGRYTRLLEKHKGAVKRYDELRALLDIHGVQIAALESWDLPIELKEIELIITDSLGDDDDEEHYVEDDD